MWSFWQLKIGNFLDQKIFPLQKLLLCNIWTRSIPPDNRCFDKGGHGSFLLSFWTALRKLHFIENCGYFHAQAEQLLLFSIFLQGNLKFSVDGDTPVIENSKLVSVIADLLSTKADMVEKALLFRTVATGRDVIDKQHTEQEATYGRNAFAKVRDCNLGCNPIYIFLRVSPIKHNEMYI